MAATHTADIPIQGSIESTFRQAAAAGLCADADFATDQATTLANIATRNAALHVSQQGLLQKLYHAVKVGFAVLGATTMISDLATIYTACEGTWAAGFEV